MKHAVLEQMELSEAARSTLDALFSATKHNLMNIKHDIRRLSGNRDGSVIIYFFGEGEHGESIRDISLRVDPSGEFCIFGALRNPNDTYGIGWDSCGREIEEDDCLGFAELIDALVTGKKQEW